MTAGTVDVFGFQVRVESALSPAEERALFGGWRPRPAVTDADLTVHFVRQLPRLELAPGTGILGRGFLLRFSDRTAWFAPWRQGPSSQMRSWWVMAAIFMFNLLTETGRLKAGKRPGSRGQFVLGLHASAVAGPKGALVFCGHSGYGKSTLAKKLLRDYPLIAEDWTTLLGEDQNGKDPCRLACCNVPRYVAETFGKAGLTTSGDALMPVAGLFWLEKSERFGLHPLADAEAAAGMLSPLQAGCESATVKRRLGLLGRVLEARPCQRLEFRRERSGVVKLLSDAGYL